MDHAFRSKASIQAQAATISKLDDHEEMIRAAYERCRPEDTFEDLKRRSRFSKTDRLLLEHWVKVGGYRGR